MKALFDNVSAQCSKFTTKTYSTSFSLAISFLHPHLRDAVHSIYGFVRFADEIVDSFHNYDKKKLLRDFRVATDEALNDKISLNPILNAFQATAYTYNIRKEWIDIFFNSMEMDLVKTNFTEHEYRKYILGSAEAVGLMCLHVFTEKNETLFDELKPYAMKLGAAFQKINFLRDMNADKTLLGRVYFPGVDFNDFCNQAKKKIESEIESDFAEALKGIKLLPASSRNGVYLAYYYYMALFKKIRRLPPKKLFTQRIRIPNGKKIILMIHSNLRHQFNLL
jgi:phytoene/squalene synthetase